MYQLTDRQIAYILDDIRRNGIELEDLQYNLLDHICCILEHDLKEGDDFESRYHATVKQFYTNDLCEIEEETIHLLTFKNFYAMKKTMLTSGVLSVAAFAVGSFLKIMHWPGASTMLILAMLLLSVVFIPLMAILRTGQSKTLSEKLATVAGALVGVLYIFSSLFAIQHWEGRTVLWLTTVIMSMFVFIPIYLYNEMQGKDKQQAIITSILMVGFTATLFTMINLR